MIHRKGIKNFAVVILRRRPAGSRAGIGAGAGRDTGRYLRAYLFTIQHPLPVDGDRPRSRGTAAAASHGEPNRLHRQPGDRSRADTS